MNNTRLKLIRSVEEYADRYGMLDCTDIIVGFSGGADSSLLLFVLTEISRMRGISIVCAHVNHMLRGEEADEDELFCRTRCNELGVELRSLRLDVGAEAKKKNLGVEECAREIRYGFFDSIKNELEQKGKTVKVAVAHNATDNTETVLFNVARGSALKGACGIPPVRDGYIVRPILRIPKAEVLSLCSELDIKYVTDKTNAECVYTRNKIRHNAIPTLREINPSVEEAVSRMTESLRVDSQYLEQESKRLLLDATNERNELRAQVLSSLHPALRSRVLRLYFDDCKAGYEHSHIESAMKLIERGGEFSLSLIGSLRLACKSGVLLIEKDDRKRRCENHSWQTHLRIGDNPLSDGAHIYLFSKKEDVEKIKTQNVYKLFIQHSLTGDTIGNVFIARSRREGDRIRYGGHSHKLKNLFSEMKIPPSERSSVPVIERDGEIVWIPGIKAADTRTCDGILFAVYAKK